MICAFSLEAAKARSAFGRHSPEMRSILGPGCRIYNSVSAYSVVTLRSSATSPSMPSTVPFRLYCQHLNL